MSAPAEPARPGGRTTRRYGTSRQDLAEAAIRLFEDEGFAETTVERIAETAGYSPRTFHRQFPAKEDAVFFDLPSILAPLEALVGRAPADAWDAVCAVVVDDAARWEAAEPALALRRVRLIHEEPTLYRRFLEISTEWEAVVATIFATAGGHAGDASTDVAAQVAGASVVAACRAAFRLWLALPDCSLAALTAECLERVRAGVSDSVSG